MATPGDTGARRYSFEKYRPIHETRLDAQKAESDAMALLERLGQKEPAGGFSKHPLFPAVRDYCSEVTVNIEWYEERRQRAERSWKRIFLGVIAAGALTSLLAVSLATWLKTEAAITLFLAAFLPAAQGLASAIDHKARMGGFWKAAADLKELLFRMEEAWRGRELEQDRVTYRLEEHDVERTFEEVLKLDRATARQIGRAERESFFNTFKSPAEVITRFSESIASSRKPDEPSSEGRRGDDTATVPGAGTPRSPAATQPPGQETPALASALPELSARLKDSADGLMRIVQDIEDPKKRAEALATAMKLVQGLSKELDKQS
jgi:hypothetical protein